MPFTNSIVGYINEYLKDGALKSAVFGNAKYYNTASAMVFAGDDGPVTAPGVITPDGEVEGVYPDDLFNIQIYHKTLSNSYSAQKEGSVGDSVDVLCVTEMQLFVFAIASRIKMTAEQLEPFFIFGLPGGLSRLLMNEIKLKSCSITAIGSDMDKYRNSRSEFQNTKDFLNPEHIFFSVRYQIRKVFNKDCMDACLVCN